MTGVKKNNTGRDNAKLEAKSEVHIITVWSNALAPVDIKKLKTALVVIGIRIPKTRKYNMALMLATRLYL